MSDVVATILLLALTVVLFSSIFAFVTRFPAPPAQSVTQFESGVVTNGSASIYGLWILHGAGPVVPTSDRVYLESTASSTDWQFQQTSGIPVAWGTGNTSLPWNVGQYWRTWFTTPIHMPANLTVYVVSPTSLLYTAYVPGVTPNNPPVVVSTGTVPSNPTVGSAFQIYALIYGNTGTLQVNITLNEIPGLPSTAQKMVNVSGRWVYNVTAHATTTNGSYVGFIQGKNTSGTTVAGQVAIAISGVSTGGGGGGSSSTVKVSVGVTTPPPIPIKTAPPNTYLSATITYNGTGTGKAVSVTFAVSQLEGGRGAKVAYYNVSGIAGQSGQTISKNQTLTIYSASPFNTWYLDSRATVSASVTVSGVTPVSANNTFATQNLTYGAVYVTTSSTGALTGQESSFSHSCTTTGGGANCPYLYLTVWDNFTSAYGGPGNLSFNGSVYVNATAGHCTGCTASTKYTVPTSTVTAGSSLAVNTQGTTTRWKPAGTVASGDQFLITMVLQVEWYGTTTVIAYIYDTFSMSLT